MSEDRIDIEVEGGWETLAGAKALVRIAAGSALSSPFPLDGGKAGIGGEHLSLPSPPSNLPPSRGKALSISIFLTTDAALAELNGRFRQKPQPTNVLSFPAPPSFDGHLGDIAIAYETCVREASEQGKTLSDHLQHLVAHGVLHLVGYDHETVADALVMEDLERRILAGLGVADPYAWRGDVND